MSEEGVVEELWPAIGIDLGTTYSCVGVWQAQHDRVEIITNDLGNRTTPYWVAFNQHERIIGEAAKNQSARNPSNTVFGDAIEKTTKWLLWNNNLLPEACKFEDKLKELESICEPILEKKHQEEALDVGVGSTVDMSPKIEIIDLD